MPDFAELAPGDSVVVEGCSYSVTSVVYPFDPRTGRGLLQVHKASVVVDYALKIFDLRQRRNLRESVHREVVALNKTLGFPEHFPKARALELQADWALVLLDWMEGVPLSQAVSGPPKGPADVRFRLRLLTRLSQAVALIHRARLLHRDLKPDNVLLRSAKDPERGVSIIDFGLAAEPRGAEEGTFGYRAPEQFIGRHLNLTSAVDVFAIGQIGCWLMTGAPLPLFASGGTDWDDMPLSAALAQQPAVPNALEPILLRALQFAPERRFGSCGELRQALANLRI